MCVFLGGKAKKKKINETVWNLSVDLTLGFQSQWEEGFVLHLVKLGSANANPGKKREANILQQKESNQLFSEYQERMEAVYTSAKDEPKLL